MGSQLRPEHSVHFTQPFWEAMELMRGGDGSQLASGGAQGGYWGTPAIQLEGGTTSGVGPHSWQKDRDTYRQKHGETEGPRDLERHRDSQRHHTPLSFGPSLSLDKTWLPPQPSPLLPRGIRWTGEAVPQRGIPSLHPWVYFEERRGGNKP